MKNVYDVLNERGLIKQVTDENIKERLNSEISLYCGFDPTGSSLHVGHLLPIILLKHFEREGHTPIALVGGATGCIGDPSFKKDERSLNSYETVEMYASNLMSQLKRFLDPNKTKFVNNMDWVSQISAIEFLRDYGKAFSINMMMSKDSVASRVESGLSFTEFSYQILQALDFKHLNEYYDCELQIGGSDQWGNITAGTELIRKISNEKKVYGITVPLVTKSDGTKFGKTEGDAIWLNPELTSPYEFYQFFFQTNDADVINYLKIFTFLDMEIINELEKKVIEEPYKREAQKTLAQEITKFVHGEEGLLMAQTVSEILFTGDLGKLTKEEVKLNFGNLIENQIENQTQLVDVLIAANLSTSRRESREFISQGAVSINGNKIDSNEYIVTKDDAIGEVYLLIKRGKKKFSFVEIK